MKNSKKKILCIILAAITTFGLTACGKDVDKSPDTNTVEQLKIADREYFSNAKDANGNDLKLIENGQSEYVIVCPEKPNSFEKLATNELSSILYKSTGCELRVCSDKGIVYDESKCYLSVGNTEVFKAANLEISEEKLGVRGFCLSTRGKQVLMNGAEGYGVLNAVYKFLYYEVGFEAFALDEIYYDTVESLSLKNFPDISYKFATGSAIFTDRSTNIPACASDLAKMYLIVGADSGITLDDHMMIGMTWVGSLSSIVPESDPENKQWFNSSQYCMSRQGAIENYANKMYSIIKSDPTGKYYMFAGHDNTSYCQCESCLKVLKETTGGGLMVRFLNKVDEIIRGKLAQEEDEALRNREVVLIGLAYYAYDSAPVVENPDGTFTVLNEEDKPNPTVGVMYTPIRACFSHPLTSTECEMNQDVRKNVYAWHYLVGDKMMFYTYGINYSNYFLFFDDYNSHKENAEAYKAVETQYLFMQGNSHNKHSPFYEYKLYLQSKLWDDPEQDMEELTLRFFKQYYKEVWKEMYGFLDAMRTRWVYNEQLASGWEHSDIYSSQLNWSEAKYWPRELLDKWYEEYFNPAYAILKAKYSGEEYEKMYKRVLAIEIYIRYIKLSNYKSSFGDYETAYAKFIQDCILLGITKFNETGTEQIG